MLKPNALNPGAMNNWDSFMKGVEMPFPRERSVLDFFREKVHERPDALAVKDAGRRMTYGELDLCSNRVANEILRRGLKLEEPVAVLLPASFDFLAAILGVLKEVVPQCGHSAGRQRQPAGAVGCGGREKLQRLVRRCSGGRENHSAIRRGGGSGSPRSFRSQPTRLHHLYVRLDRPAQGR